MFAGNVAVLLVAFFPYLEGMIEWMEHQPRGWTRDRAVLSFVTALCLLEYALFSIEDDILVRRRRTTPTTP
jgi:hypothetical protein